MHSPLYLVVADSSLADIYLVNDDMQSMELIEQKRHPDSRLTRQELDSDRPGSTASAGRGYHGLGGDQDSHHRESADFARELGHHLHQIHLSGKFKHLLLSAPPHFLGDLREHLSKDCLKVLGKTVNKNLTRLPASEILAHFRD